MKSHQEIVSWLKGAVGTALELPSKYDRMSKEEVEEIYKQVINGEY